ncbi:MAG: class I SAM-dependent methyltransferase [Parashewanella sp.]
MNSKLTSTLLTIAVSISSLSFVANATDTESKLSYSNQYRSEKEVARDKYRHPKQTLQFFGVQPSDTVVEIWPGGGWYTQILAPALKGKGEFIAAHWPKDSNVRFFKVNRAKFDQKFTLHPERYGEISVTDFAPPSHLQMAPSGSADVVLTFRNVHNWMKRNQEQTVFNSAYKALKPGGIFGVVEHRAKPGTDRLTMIESGYVTEEYVKQLAAKAGFKLVDSSEINANARDTKSYPSGVWTLPPSLRLGDLDRAKYLAIGESDRMTLKFKKPN